MKTQAARVLFIDDEERVVRSLGMMFKSHFQVLCTTDPGEALQMLRDQHVHVLVSDQRMPQMLGVELLQRTRELSPNTLRLLLTGYSDLAAIRRSINEGEIFRYITKPWDPVLLRSTLLHAAEIGLQLEGSAAPPQLAEPAQAVKVLVIDDAEQTWLDIKECLGNRFEVQWSSSLEDAFRLLSEEHFELVITDVRLRGQNIQAAIKALKQASPTTLTIVLTAFQDSALLIELINQGQVFRYLPKPVRPRLLQMSAEAATAHYRRLRALPKLIRQHEVLPPSKPPELSIPQRVLGFLKGIRDRFANEST